MPKKKRKKRKVRKQKIRCSPLEQYAGVLLKNGRGAKVPKIKKYRVKASVKIPKIKLPKY